MDGISTSTLLIILGVLILVSGFFSSSETGMMSLNKYKLKHLVENKNKGAIRVNKLLERPDRLIGLILIGNNLVNIAASALATIIGMRLFGDLGVAIATIALTVVILIFAEVTPKTLAAWFPEKIAYPASLILTPLLTLFYPLVYGLNAITNGILKLFKINPKDASEQVLSQEELRTVVNEAGSMIPRKHQDMLLSILDLEKVTVEDVMVPRNEIEAIDINDDWKDISRQLTHGKYSSILLYRDSMDDAVGFVHARDVLRLSSKTQFSKESLLRSAREIYFVPEGTPLNIQLIKFQRNKVHIGLVVDEYGDIQGLITLEDILEEIVGDFSTNIAPIANEEVHKQSDGSFLLDGGANVRDLSKEHGWKLPTDGPRTINGLILEYLEAIPENNLSVRLYGYPIDIIEVNDNAIKRVRIYPDLFQENSKEEEQA